MKDLLIDKLRVLSEDKVMIEAIRGIFEEKIEEAKPDTEGDDNLIGQKYRAYDQSKKLLNQVLLDIETYKDGKVGSNTFNKSK